MPHNTVKPLATVAKSLCIINGMAHLDPACRVSSSDKELVWGRKLGDLVG